MLVVLVGRRLDHKFDQTTPCFVEESPKGAIGCFRDLPEETTDPSPSLGATIAQEMGAQALV